MAVSENRQYLTVTFLTFAFSEAGGNFGIALAYVPSHRAAVRSRSLCDENCQAAEPKEILLTGIPKDNLYCLCLSLLLHLPGWYKN